MNAHPYALLRTWSPRLLGLAAMWTFTVGASSCSVSDSAGPTFVTTLELRNAAGAPDRQFAPGEAITFELSVRNRTRSPATLQFSSGQLHDFVVFNDGTSQVRWRWSTGRVFPAIAEEIEFAAGETKRFQVTWDQRADDGQPVGAGDFEARGTMMFAQFATDPFFPSQLASALEQFSIR